MPPRTKVLTNKLRFVGKPGESRCSWCFPNPQRPPIAEGRRLGLAKDNNSILFSTYDLAVVIAEVSLSLTIDLESQHYYCQYYLFDKHLKI